MTDWERIRDEAAAKYSERLPTKSEWIAGKKDTHSYLSYEVKYEIEDAFEDGWSAAIANDPRVKALFNSANEVDSIVTLIKKSNGKNTNLLFDLDDAHKRLSQALKAFEGSGE